IELLFRPEGILLDFLPVMRSFATRTVGSGHHRYLAECCFALYCTPLQHVQTSRVARQSLEPVCVYHPLAKCGGRAKIRYGIQSIINKKREDSVLEQLSPLESSTSRSIRSMPL